MGRMLQYREKDKKWRLWTTISDGWLTEWLTEQEMKEELAYDFQTDYKLRVIESYMTFPHGYFDKKTQKRLTDFDKVQAFTEWHLKVLKMDDYYEQVDAKFLEVKGE